LDSGIGIIAKTDLLSLYIKVASTTAIQIIILSWYSLTHMFLSSLTLLLTLNKCRCGTFEMSNRSKNLQVLAKLD